MDQGEQARAITFAPGMSRGAAQAELRRALAEAGIDSAMLDARLLTGAALQVSSTALLAHPEAPLGDGGAARLTEFAGRRLAREPVSRITGQAEFWGLPFRLSPETLAPRPDTETVVEAALEAVGTVRQELRMLDLGTGSGCILLALLSELKGCFGIGIDRFPGALATAKGNAEMNGLRDRTAFVASNWAAALDGRFDLIVSNPPYVRASEIPALEPEVSRFDPLAALDGGNDGLNAYRAILDDAGRLLTPEGRVVLELGHDQSESVSALAQARDFVVETIRRDVAGHLRALVLRLRRDLVSGG
jgi:release factor glutamine methyltransferase